MAAAPSSCRTTDCSRVETVRRNLLEQCDVHTLLRLPTGFFYVQRGQGERPVPRCQANSGEALDEIAVGLRPADEHALHPEDDPAERADLDEFVECYRPGKRHLRKPIWTEANPEGRSRSFD